MLEHESITDIPESDLVARLLNERREQLIGIVGFPSNPIIRTSILLDGLPNRPRGDVDILLWSAGCPDQAIAIQAKRVKYSISGIRTGKPNKIHELATARRQANLLAKIGFWKVYLYVAVVVDTREQNAEKEVSYAGLNGYLQGKLHEVESTAGLDTRVGLAHYDYVQPMDHPPLTVGTWGLSLVRLAPEFEQPEEVTKWVDELEVPPRS